MHSPCEACCMGVTKRMGSTLRQRRSRLTSCKLHARDTRSPPAPLLTRPRHRLAPHCTTSYSTAYCCTSKPSLRHRYLLEPSCTRRSNVPNLTAPPPHLTATAFYHTGGLNRTQRHRAQSHCSRPYRTPPRRIQLHCSAVPEFATLF